MTTLESIQQPIERDLREFEAFVRRNFTVKDELLSGMVDYVLEGRGKRVRPMLVLLSAALNSPDAARGATPRVHLAAMLVEMIHTASLVHDDVIDEADTRRGRPSANAKWQSRMAVLVGDYILARNMEIGMRSGQYDIVQHVIGVIAILCEGEVLQDHRAKRAEMTRESYLEIIYKKTALLLGLSASAGALAVRAPHDRVEEMRRFGDALGMAFQIQDDLLDYRRVAATGKPVCNDLREGKITLPLLLLLDRAGAARRAELLGWLKRCHDDEACVERLRAAVEEAGTLDETALVMREYLRKATAALARWPDSPARTALVELCAYVGERDR